MNLSKVKNSSALKFWMKNSINKKSRDVQEAGFGFIEMQKERRQPYDEAI